MSSLPADGRRHDIDVLRISAFTLLILYHASGVWQRDSDFVIVSDYQNGWIEWLRIVVNRWRMPLLFVISGVALSLAMQTRPQPGWRRALRSTRRLLLPLVFAMLVIVPVQPYVQAVLRGAVEPGYLAFWWRYLQLQPWPEGSFSGAQYGVTWMHLWYLPYLWCYTLVLLLARPLLDSGPVQRLRSLWLRCHPLAWILATAGWVFVCLWWLMPRFPESHALIGDWFAHGLYFSCFLAGWLIARDEPFWHRLRRWRWPLLWMALAAISIELGLRTAGRLLGPGELPSWAWHVPWAMIERAARATYTCTALLAILGWASLYLNRPFRWLPRANEAVYPCYILHQSLLVLLAYWLLPWRLGPWLEPLLVIGGTFAGCWLAYTLVIRRIGTLRALFGLEPERTAPRQPSAVATPR